MHRIIKAHLDSFIQSRGLQAEEESTQFEKFSNFSIISSISSASFDLDDVTTGIKVVETNNEDVFSELVRATNSQSKIENAQFLSLRPVIKRVEQYFGTYPAESRLYFERRDRQYVGQDVPAIRIFSMHNAAKCVAAMYCNRPELSSRYPKAMYQELTEVIFADGVKENVFYAACLTMYRLSLLVSNGVIPQNMKRFKWHILSIVRAMVSGKESVALNSRQASNSADLIIAKMAQHGAETTEFFAKAVNICNGLGVVSADRLKRQAILGEMLAAI